MEHTFYDALGIESNATQVDIKNAYREKCIQYHPKNISNENVEFNHNMSYKINEAYSVLIDLERRIIYDEYLNSISKKPINTIINYDSLYSKDFSLEEQSEHIAWLESYINYYLLSMLDYYTDPKTLIIRYRTMRYSFDEVLGHEVERYNSMKRNRKI